VFRVAVGALLAAMVVAGVGHRAFGWDLGGWLPWMPGCAFRSVTGIPCPGCGMTRAFLLLSQLRLGEAFATNPASPALVTAMAAWWVLPPRRSPRTANVAWAAALVAVLLSWGLRYLPHGLRLPL
jgi:hypothetical protein